MPDDGGPREIERLRGSVRILRLVAATLALAAGVLFLAPARTPERASEVIDVPARMRAIDAARGLDANEADFYLDRPSLSVHLHYMGGRHLCPLHLHPRGDEAAVIVEGTAEVRHVFRKDGVIEAAARTFHDGELVASPPGCAHAFTNLERDRALGTLVLSSPAFDHNTYLADEADERIGASAPTTYSFADEIAAFARGADEQRRVPLGAMGGAVSLLLVRGSAAIEPGSSAESVLYVLAGSGRVEAERTLDVGPKHLAIVRTRSAFFVRAASVLAALIHAE